MPRSLVAGFVLIAVLLGMLVGERTAQAITCAQPYHAATADGRCVWSCGQGTQPDQALGQCVCQGGLTESGSDQFGRRVCTAAAACEGPYHVTASDGRCVWSCGQGTQPDQASGQCVCQAGMTQSGSDQFGRRVCTAAAACEGPYHVTASDGRCVWSCAQGTQPHQASGECRCQPGLRQTGQDRFGRRICGQGGGQGGGAAACEGPYHVQAKDGRCVWSCGKGTRPDQASGQCRCQPGLQQTGRDRFGRRVCGRGGGAASCPKPYHVPTQDGRCVWSCAKGTQPDQRSGQCVCQRGLKEAGFDRNRRRVCK